MLLPRFLLTKLIFWHSWDKKVGKRIGQLVMISYFR